MKTNLLQLVLTSVAALTLSAPLALQAQSTNTMSATSSTTTTSTAKMKKMDFGGKVKTVDTAANTLTVQSHKRTVTVMVDDSTMIMKADGTKGTLSDINMGEHVMGSYMKDDSGKMVACKINVHAGKMGKTSMPSTNAAPANP